MKNKPLKYIIGTLLSFIFFTHSIFASVPPNIIGQSAILIDTATGSILYQKNANIQMYPASTTKILTAILALEHLDTTSSMIKTSEAVQSVPSDSSHIGLRIGDIFPVIDGIHAVMLGSDNYVSHDLATLLDGSIQTFASRMNIKAKQMGANSSHFVNPHGYHDPTHYTTAYDLALIMDYAIKNHNFLNMIQSKSYTLSRLNDLDHPIDFNSTVKLIDPESPYYYPYTLGGKTGFTSAAGRCLVAVARKDGMDLVGVVLKSERQTFFQDMSALFDYGFENFKLKEEEGVAYLENNSYSPWAKEIVAFSREHELILNNTNNFQTAISKEDFITLLMQTIFMAQGGDLGGFSKDLAINQALAEDLIQSTSLLSGFNSPISRESAAYLTAQLLSSVNYNPVKTHPLHFYRDQHLISKEYMHAVYYLQQNGIMGSSIKGDFNPKENLTLEEGLSVATQLYKLYSASPYSYINRSKKATF